MEDELFEDAPCGHLVTEPDGTIVLVNRTFEQLTGHRREDVIGRRRFQDLLAPGGRIYYETHCAPLLRMQGAMREIALDVVRADGTRMSALVNAVLVGGGIRVAVFPAADRRRYESELLDARNRAERLQRMTAAIAAAPDAEAVAGAVTAALVEGLAARDAVLSVHDARTESTRVLGRPGASPGELGPRGAAVFDEGSETGSGARVRVPLRHARTSGVLAVDFAAPRALSAEDRAFVEACAAQAGMALDRALLLEEQREVAHALQRSLLAGGPPADLRFRVATLYEPGVDGLEVGGDWYDTFLLPGGDVAVVVGDVVGRGLAAASAMGQLRSAVRALAGAELGPAGVLDELDTFVEQTPKGRFATVAYAEIEPDTGVARLARAGHVPPVVVACDGRPELVAAGGSAPLGVRLATARPETEVRIEPGGGLLLYTDGLVERRTEPIDVGLSRLLDALAPRASLSPADLVVSLRDAMLTPGRSDDDVCCLWFERRAGERRAARRR